MDLFEKAKEILDTVEIKAGEFIYDQKCNIKIAKVCAELKKAYENLGRLSYRKIKELPVNDNEFESAVLSVELLKSELNALRSGTYQDDSYSVIFEDADVIADSEENDNKDE